MQILGYNTQSSASQDQVVRCQVNMFALPEAEVGDLLEEASFIFFFFFKSSPKNIFFPLLLRETETETDIH